jgi:preprotein translocase subunit SecG
MTMVVASPAIILFILWIVLTLTLTNVFKNNESKITSYDDSNGLIKDKLRPAYTAPS